MKRQRKIEKKKERKLKESMILKTGILTIKDGVFYDDDPEGDWSKPPATWFDASLYEKYYKKETKLKKACSVVGDFEKMLLGRVEATTFENIPNDIKSNMVMLSYNLKTKSVSIDKNHFLTGSTYAIKDNIKALGGVWTPEHKGWDLSKSRYIEDVLLMDADIQIHFKYRDKSLKMKKIYIENAFKIYRVSKHNRNIKSLLYKSE